ncbi:MAG: AglZ/HisF2 family acetamidino modification protein [Bacteriovoracaceae bacterium]
MLEKRIIPSLLLSQGKLVKTVKFKDPKYIGDPINTVKIFNNKGADELFIIDIDASREKKEPNYSLLEQIATEAFMPLGYAGGIQNLSQMEKIFSLGFEKVALSSVLFENPSLITEAIKLFGSQSVVGIIDIDKSFLKGKKAFNHLNPKQSCSPLEMAMKLQELGAGEIILHFAYREGTYTGYDLELINQISKKLTVPLVVLGGASSKDDLASALKSGADAAAAGSLFIYHGPHKAVLVNYPKRIEIEEILLKGK